jgi:3-isopropylmalate dehydrogenase
VLVACQDSDAVLLGAVGGPKWDTTDPDAPRPEQGLLGLRKGMGLYANLRPVRPSPALVGASPLREERIAGTDLLVVRELTGGHLLRRQRPRGRLRPRHLRILARRDRADRPRRLRGGAATGRGSGRDARVTSVDKANVLETSRLWREVVERGRRPTIRHVALDHLLVDNAAMQLVSRPADST